MRLLAISVLLAVAFADGPSPLATAIGRFGDDRPDVRRDASAEVDRHLRRELAPLLEAMESPDPEVRRRAVEALRGLLPPAPEPEAPEIPEEQLLFINRAGGGGNVVIQVQGVAPWNRRMRRLPAVAGVDEKDIEALRRFGVEGHAVADETMRRQLRLGEGRGFQVRAVVEESVAEALGLQPHDIVLRAGEGPVMRIQELAEALGPEEGWARLRFRVLRDGELVDLPGER